MAATLTIGGVAVTMIEDQHDLTNALDERQRFKCDVIDYSGTLHFVKGEQVILSDPVLGVLYSGYLNSDKEVYQYPTGAILHTIDCIDQHYLADKRTYTRTYSTPQLAGKIVVDQLHDVLSQEGIAQNYALKFDTTNTDFNAGVLSNVAGFLNVGDGDLELVKAGSDVTITENTTATFSTGTLTNVVAASNSLTPTTQSALFYQSNLALNLAGNNYIYTQVWSGSQTIGTSDTLHYDVWLPDISKNTACAVDFLCSDGTLLRNLSLVDQNQVSTKPTTDLSLYAKNQWYSRSISLSSLSGRTITAVYLDFTGSAVGETLAYFKNIYLGSSPGSPFFSTVATMPQLNPPAVQYAAGYSTLQTTITVVQAFNPAASSRVSTAYSIDAVKLLRSSLATFRGTTPGSSTVGINVSYDGGVSYLACTNNAALPALPAGSNVAGMTITLQEVFGTSGSDPTAIPSLLSVSIAIISAAVATKSDVVTSYASQTSWNTGTFTNAQSLTSGGVTLSTYTRNWNDHAITNQSFQTVTESGQTVTQSASSGAYVISASKNIDNTVWAEGVSRMDIAGLVQDFTLDIDLTASYPASNSTDIGITYRQQDWSSAYIFSITTGPGVGSPGSILYVGYGNPLQFLGIPTNLYGAGISLGTSNHVKLVVSGSSHTVYLNNSATPSISLTDTSYVGPGYIGLLGKNEDATNTNTFSFDNFVLNPTSATGTWQSPSTALSGTCGGSVIYWTAAGASSSAASLIVQSSIDSGSTFQICTNGGTIPGLTSGVSLSGKSVIMKVTMATLSQNIPILNTLTFRVLGAYPGSSGTRSTIPLGNDMSITRTVGSGWGTAFDGQTYSQTGTGTTAVTAGEATIANTTGDVHMILGSRTWTDEDGTCRFSLSAATISAGIELRYSDVNDFYRLQASTTALSIVRVAGGVSQTLKTVVVSLSTATFYRLRFRVVGSGPVILYGNVWQDGTLEPVSWTIAATS